MLTALIVDRDTAFAADISGQVAEHGFKAHIATSVSAARAVIASRTVAAAVIDPDLPDGSGLDLLPPLQGPPVAEVAIVTAKSTIESAVLAFRWGALDYLPKPPDPERLAAFLVHARRASELRIRRPPPGAATDPVNPLERLLGASPQMDTVRELIRRAGPTDATVLVTGETGTGKELVAQSLHALSPRARKPLVAINCGAMAPTLIESELFGHEKGSFTGADRRRLGAFERADGGTLFLDEIAEMPLDTQVKFLRVLESRTLNRVGGDLPIPFDVRIVAATNRNPAQAVRDGLLRDDLLYRLLVVPIELPPLRDRGDDVKLLAERFVDELNARYGTQKELTTEALEQLDSYDWPGNVRELRNMVERAIVVGPDKIQFKVIPVSVPAPTGASQRISVGSTLAEMEHKLILATLESLRGNKPKTARALGISLKTLYNRLNEYRTR